MVPLRDSDFGTLLGNGSWTGMKGQLQRKVKSILISNSIKDQDKTCLAIYIEPFAVLGFTVLLK